MRKNRLLNLQQRNNQEVKKCIFAERIHFDANLPTLRMHLQTR